MKPAEAGARTVSQHEWEQYLMDHMLRIAGTTTASKVSSAYDRIHQSLVRCAEQVLVELDRPEWNTMLKRAISLQPTPQSPSEYALYMLQPGSKTMQMERKVLTGLGHAKIRALVRKLVLINALPWLVRYHILHEMLSFANTVADDGYQQLWTNVKRCPVLACLFEHVQSWSL